MGQNNWQQIEQIIDRALDLPKDKRKEFIDTHCEGKPELKGEVTQLLESIFDSEGWLENPEDYKRNVYEEISDDVQLLSTQDSLVGTQVGSYQIVEQIGKGGMGTVYLAEHVSEKIDHQVAIKIIQTAKATEHNLLRFKREQQILAGLHHPSIARLYDAGTTEDGFPYIIMEYVNGTPVDSYCRKHNCSIDQKLKIFVDILEAVRYAHENLVIHRDLKPDNILIDKSGNVKILDFGISKLIEDNEDQSLTKTGARLLTPRFAAPEQVRQENITTATDLYALGVIFYRLLTGKYHLDFSELSRFEIEQAIINAKAPKPSSKVSDSKTRKLLHGDLDAIALKAIRKEPEHRYRVANEFLEDLKNYEHGIPVSAIEDSFRYRSQKFLKRHKRAITAASIILILLIGLTGFYTWRIAEERNKAQLQAERAEQVSEFMVNLFQSNFPENASGEDIPVSTVIDAGIENLNEQELSPVNRATILGVIAQIQINLSNLETAQELSSQAFDLVMDSVEKHNKNTIEIPLVHGSVASMNGDFKKAEKLYNIADSLFKDNNLTHTYGYRLVKYNLANLYNEQKRYQETLETLESLNPKTFGDDEEALTEKSDFYNYKATALNGLGKAEEALPIYKKTLEYRLQVFGPNNSEVGTAYNNISGVYISLDQYEKAIEYAQKAYEIRNKTLGPDHVFTATPIWSMSISNRYLGNYQEALNNAEKAAEILKNALDENHWRYAYTVRGQAQVLLEMERFQEAKKKMDEAIEIINTNYPSNAAFKAYFNATYANIYEELNELDKAAQYYDQSISFLKEGLGETHPLLRETLTSYAKMEMGRQNHKKALPFLKEALKIQKHNERGEEELQVTQKLLGKCQKALNSSSSIPATS